MVDKTQAVIEYLLTSEYVKNSPFYFNFVNAADEDKQFVTSSNEKILHEPYIDGSVAKRFTFTIIDYRSIAYQELPKELIETNENVEEYLDVQTIIDWIDEKNTAKEFPDFGDTCIVEEIKTTTDNPNLNGVDTNVKPALAKYSVSIQIDYLDISKRYYKKSCNE